MFTLSACLSCITWETSKWIFFTFTNTFANTNTNIRTNLCGSGGCLHCLSVIAASHVNSKQLYFDVNQVKIGENMLSFYAQSKGEIIITGRDFKYQSHGHKCTGTWKIQQTCKDWFGYQLNYSINQLASLIVLCSIFKPNKKILRSSFV